MAHLFFTRTARVVSHYHGRLSKDEAEILASTAAAASDVGEEFEADYFEELADDFIAPHNLDNRCFAGPWEVNLRSIEYGFGTLRFTVSQRCLYFCNNMDFEKSMDEAELLALSDNVSQSVEIDTSVKGCWIFTAPEGIPNSALRDVYAPAVPKHQNCLFVRAVKCQKDSA